MKKKIFKDGKKGTRKGKTQRSHNLCKDEPA